MGGGRLGGVGLCHSPSVKVRGQFHAVGFLLLPLCGFWGSNSKGQASRAGQVPLPAVLSYQSLCIVLNQESFLL